MDNHITISGNLTREPELRFTQTGKPVCNLGVAVNNRFQVNGQWQERTSFMQCVVWGDMGENCARSLHKGNRVTVTGRIEQRAYDTAGGDRKVATDIVAEDVSVSLKWAVVEGILKTTSAVAPGDEAPAPSDADAPDAPAEQPR
jgi:single-strand DNA-binding protein